MKTTYYVTLRVYRSGSGKPFDRVPVLFYNDHYGDLVCYDEKEQHSAAALEFYYHRTRAPMSGVELANAQLLFDRYVKADIANNGEDRTEFVEFKRSRQLKLPKRHKE